MRTRNRSIASAVGTFPSLAPVMGWLLINPTQPFGNRHPALDVAAPLGDPHHNPAT